MRDEYRVDYDEGRGGYGNIVKAQLTQRQKEMVNQMQEYEAGQDDGPTASPPRKRTRRGDDSDDD